MVRALGAVLIIMGTGAWGAVSAATVSRRAKSLRCIVSALDTMQTEICTRLMPMECVIETVYAQSEADVRRFFENVLAGLVRVGERDFSSIWRQAIKSTPELGLTRGQAFILSQLGSSLGKYDAREQKRALDYAIAEFRKYADRAESEKQTRVRLNAFMGVAAGVFAVVILL